MGIEQITCIQVAMAFTPSCYRAIQRAKRKEGNIGIELIPESKWPWPSLPPATGLSSEPPENPQSSAPMTSEKLFLKIQESKLETRVFKK